jgi:hypothetical protein
MGSTAAAPRPTPISPEPWIALRGTLDAMLAPLGELALARLAPHRDHAVLDLGCGCGTTTLDLAAAVANKPMLSPSLIFLSIAFDFVRAHSKLWLIKEFILRSTCFILSIIIEMYSSAVISCSLIFRETTKAGSS